MQRTVRSGRVRLSAVVLAELYAGTRSALDKADLDAVFRAYRSIGFLVTPGAEEWARAGQGIRRYRRAYGDLHARDHMNDVLVLLCAAKVSAVTVTEDRSFVRWSALLRRMGVSVRVQAVQRSAYGPP